MHEVHIGDAFVEVWGYDQLNVDCYVVTAVTETSVGIKPCGRRNVRPGEFGDEYIPEPEHVLEWPRQSVILDDGTIGEGKQVSRIGKVRKDGSVLKRVMVSHYDSPYLKMTSYSRAYLWDGERSYFETNPLYGH